MNRKFSESATGRDEPGNSRNNTIEASFYQGGLVSRLGQWRAKTFFEPTAALELLDLVLDMLWCMRMIKKDSACCETALSPEQRRRLFQHTPQTIHISPPDEFWQVPVYYPPRTAPWLAQYPCNLRRHRRARGIFDQTILRAHDAVMSCMGVFAHVGLVSSPKP